MATQFIWRKSIVDNDFKCTQCGHLLVGYDGMPIGASINSIDNPTELYCGRCNYQVGKIKHISDKVMEYMGVKPNIKGNNLGNLDDFCDEMEKKIDKLKTKEISLDKKLEECRHIAKENDELKQKVKALQERNKVLEDRITKENDKHYKELRKQDAEINRLYKIIENINKGV